MKKAIERLVVVIMFLCTAPILAQNPFITGQFTADPTARVFDGRMYVYPSHDIRHPRDKNHTWFCMEDYHVFSSDNLTEWTDHGTILSQEDVAWVNPDTYSMWAPDCVEKDGTYYFYFPAIGKEKGEGEYSVGVATSRHPAGPFQPMEKPIEGIVGIDPCVLIDKDGGSYIYWSGQGLSMARLDSTMVRLASQPETIKGLPDGFKEGPFVFERNGKYYLTFPWVRKNTETLAYAMSDHPMGPWEFKGIIMDESPVGCWTNHHSIVEYSGQWYLFYHHNDYSPEFDKNRSARIDSLFFNADGTIQKVVPTLRGVGVTDARSIVQIDRYSHISKEKADVEYVEASDKFEGWKLVLKEVGASVTYSRVDFGPECPAEVWLKVRSQKGGRLQLLIDGKAAAKIKVPVTTGWQLISASVKGAPKGVADIALKLLDGTDMEIDWITFADHRPLVPWSEGAFTSGSYRNLFVEAGYSQKAVDKKLKEVFEGLFYGPDKVYFEVGDSMAYISDLKNHDVRTEGMSYGMMIAVQFDQKEIFDRLWRWGRKYMQHQDGPLEGYFAWSCKTDGTRNSQGPASDGELYYVTALIFASNRWGNDTGINYLAEAQNILNCAMSKPDEGHATPFINRQRKLINFVPSSYGNRFTDPSYHVPAFYEVWARWADDGRADFWRECAVESREYLHRSVHPVTGLTPDYNHYDGTLLGGNGIIGDAFRFDSWRVPMNVALDYSWMCVDKEWQQTYADKIQQFFYGQGIETFVDQFNVDGTRPDRILDAGGKTRLRHSLGLVSTLAAASLMSTHGRNIEFVHHLWESKHEPYDDGYFDAYYDGLLRLFAFMHLSGNYRIITPADGVR